MTMVMSNQDEGSVPMNRWEGREQLKQELTQRGEPETPGERQGQPEMPAPQLHSKGSRESSLPASVSGGCVLNPYVLTVTPVKLN